MAGSNSESKVEYNFLGKSGLKVSNICLGTMTFGIPENSTNIFMRAPTQSNEELSNKILDKYVELVVTFWIQPMHIPKDYPKKIIGNWLQGQNRDDIIISTKVRAPTGLKPNQSGLSRRLMIKSCEESLDRLQTDYIDLYQSHRWDSATPIEETYRVFNDLVRCGKVRYVGVSNVTGWQLQKIVERLKVMGVDPVISLQQQYNLLCRHSEFDEFQVCVNEGIGVIPWSPLKGGLLTGKFKRGEQLDTEKSRIGFVAKDSMAKDFALAWSQYSDNESYWNLIELLNQIAKNHGKTIPQVALRWLIQKNIVSSVIMGATSVEQLENNMGAGSGWSITLDENRNEKKNYDTTRRNDKAGDSVSI